MSLTKVIAGMTDDSVFAANKNVIINGNFDIWQRGTSFASVSSNTYSADRFVWQQAGSGVVSLLRSTSVPDNTSDFSFQVDVTTADASIAASDQYTVRCYVEGYDVMRFAFGTSDAKQLTLSFYVRSSKTGIHCVTFRNSAGNRNYIVEYTINVADTWEKQTISLTVDTTGTWLTDNGRGLIIHWALATGTNNHGTANSWVSSGLATSNQVNVLDSTANNFHLSRVQIEVGSVATEFERRSFATELAMAQRYYTISTGSITGAPRVLTVVTENRVANLTLPVEMRSTPSVSSSGDLTAAANGTGQIIFNASSVPSNEARINSSWTADAEL